MTECDNLSVGVIVQHDGDTLLLERARYPWGWAAPAGHVDEHGSLEQTAVEEVWEETGLRISVDGLVKVIDGVRMQNECRRPGGDHHVWTVFRAEAPSKDTNMSEDETSGKMWVPNDKLVEMVNRSREVDQAEIQHGDELIEGVWVEFFTRAGLADK